MSQQHREHYPNRLITTSSPYLLQHAYNPVDWHPWGEEALARAKREDKPILVSIGYSTCHWCHVMERESFEDDHVAALMNQHFINIKVDREERPDVDQLYMEAVQMISGSGGWPLNCFLTPDGRPFYGGTYFPPEPMGNRPSWTQVLQHLAGLFQNKREVVETQADRLIQAVRDHQTRHFKPLDPDAGNGPSLDRGFVEEVFRDLYSDRDVRYGGFGAAPKFPRTMSLEYLLAYASYTGNAESAEHVRFSLQQMIRGGIYDQIGGGMARYATDPAWLVPHFEKMLYDNALLVDLLSKWYQWQPDEEMRQAVRDTLAFIDRELTHPRGAFYSALDADSEGEEGKFYVWSHEEFVRIAGDHATLWCDYLNVSPGGNWEGVNILHRSTDDASFARSQGMDIQTFRDRWATFREQLMATRSDRIRPGLDDKVILSWNALMIDASLTAYQAFGEEDDLIRANRALAFLLRELVDANGNLLRIYAGDRAYQDAFLDDHAFLIRARLHLLEIDFQPVALEDIQRHADQVIRAFYDQEAGAFRTSADQELQSALFDTYDSALPSGNAVMVQNLDQLGALTGRRDFVLIADRLRHQIAPSVLRFPGSFAQYAQSIMSTVFGHREIVIAGPDAPSFLRQASRLYLPGSVRLASTDGEGSVLLEDRLISGKTYLYLCQNQSCQLPVETVEELVAQL